jgi:hypothetical protein
MNGVFNHKCHYGFECAHSLLGVATTCLLKINWRHNLEIGGNNNNGNGSRNCAANGLLTSFSIHKHQVNGYETYLVGCIMFALEILIVEFLNIFFFNLNNQCIFSVFVFVIFLRGFNVSINQCLLIFQVHYLCRCVCVY